MIVSFYDLATGLFSDKTFTGSDAAVLRNTPAGEGAIEGIYDALTQRVDTNTGDVVPYTPPADRLEVRDEFSAREKIVRLEHRQARPVRELLLDPTNQVARDLLQQIDDQIVTLRQFIKSA